MSSEHTDRVVDLRELAGDAGIHGWALHAVHDLRPGHPVTLITADDPRLLVSQLQHDLRHRIATEITQASGEWRVYVRSRDETEPQTLFDILARDHERLDRLFVQAHTEVQVGRLATGRALLIDFFAGLRRHIAVENELLVPRFALARDSLSSDPTSVMLREHDDILQQTVIIEDLFANDELDASEIVIWLGLLEASLSKHEGREETRLFPLWDARLLQQPDAADIRHLVRARLENTETPPDEIRA